MPQEQHENFFIELLKFILVVLVVIVPIRLFVAQPFIISGASMDPTFRNAQYLIIDELSYHFDDPARGDVIIFRYPKDPSQFFIKRIIGLPGETVSIRDGLVYVAHGDNEPVELNEPYVVNEGNGPDRSVALGSDEYFVMGDNRPESSDSRVWGVLPRENIIGRAFVRLLPLNTIRFLPGSTPAQLTR